MFLVFKLSELPAQIVHKKRVNNFVDIFNAGVMHTACAAYVMIECRFKNCAKNRRGNLRPIEIAACLVEQKPLKFVCEVGEVDFISKKPAVDVREFFQRVVEIRTAVFKRRIKDFEQFE